MTGIESYKEIRSKEKQRIRELEERRRIRNQEVFQSPELKSELEAAIVRNQIEKIYKIAETSVDDALRYMDELFPSGKNTPKKYYGDFQLTYIDLFRRKHNDGLTDFTGLQTEPEP
jgi:hypothetical protein